MAYEQHGNGEAPATGFAGQRLATLRGRPVGLGQVNGPGAAADITTWVT